MKSISKRLLTPLPLKLLINMENFPKEISKFIKEHHVMTLATTSGEGLVACCNLFFAFEGAEKWLIFTSSSTTEHGANMAANSQVAASIVLETKVVGKIRGLQIKGGAVQVSTLGQTLSKKAKESYLKKFPFAVFAELELWALKIEECKLTDNRLGFGKKIVWSSDEQAK